MGLEEISKGLEAATQHVLREGEKLWRQSTSPFRTLPDVVIVGAQKGGTTSLYRYLCAHPDIQGGFLKEIHYFDYYYKRNPLWYRSHFGFQGQGMAIEATPHYLFDEASLWRLSALLPDITVIALLREPVSRAFSHYNHVRRGMGKWGRDHRSFQQAVEEDIEIFERGNVLGRNNYRDVFHSYVRRGVYAPQIERYQEVYGDNLVVIKSEELFSNPKSVLRSLFESLGVEPVDIGEPEPHRRGDYDDQIPMEETLKAFFEPYNKELSELTGRDFSWGY